MAAYLGIDPGASGGIALVRGLGDAEVIKMPPTETDLWDAFSELVARAKFAMIENVHAMPKQGVSSTFKFGKSYGFLRCCLIASKIPFEAVTPRKWQSTLGCLSKGDKNVTKAKAQELFPSIKVIHATADALLIAEYARRVKENGSLR